MLPPKVVGCAALLTPGANARAARAGASSSRRGDQRRIVHLSCPRQPKMQLRAGEHEVPSPAGRPAQNNDGVCQTVVTSGFGGAWRGELAPLALRHCTPRFGARGLCSSILDRSRPTPRSSDLPCCETVNCTAQPATALAASAGMQHLWGQTNSELWGRCGRTIRRGRCRRQRARSAAAGAERSAQLDPAKRGRPDFDMRDLGIVSRRLSQHGGDVPASGRTKDASEGACEAQAVDQRQAAAADCRFPVQAHHSTRSFAGSSGWRCGGGATVVRAARLHTASKLRRQQDD